MYSFNEIRMGLGDSIFHNNCNGLSRDEVMGCSGIAFGHYQVEYYYKTDIENLMLFVACVVWIGRNSEALEDDFIDKIKEILKRRNLEDLLNEIPIDSRDGRLFKTCLFYIMENPRFNLLAYEPSWDNIVAKFDMMRKKGANSPPKL